MANGRKILLSILKILKSNLLVICTLIAVVCGLILGIILKQFHLNGQALVIIAFPGEILLRLLKLLIVPLILSSIISGVVSLDLKSSSKIAIRGLAYYFSTTLLAIILGIVLVTVIKPGSKVDPPTLSFSALEAETRSTIDAALDMLRNFFPDNIVAACFSHTKTVYVYPANTTNSTELKRVLTSAEGANMSGIVCIALALGIALLTMREEASPLIKLVITTNALVMKLVIYVLWYSPVGILFLIAKNVAATSDISELFSQIGWLMLTVLLGLFIHGCITLPLLYLIIGLRNPIKLVYKMLPSLLLAFGTSSSSGAMPVTIKCLEDKVGIDKRVTQFLIPIGTTINMDGTALYEAVTAIFIAQLYRVPLTSMDIFLVVITATIASVGAAAIPSAGLITILIILNLLGLPYESIALVFSIDWFLDRFRTTINVFGDCVGAGIVESLSVKDLALPDEKRGLTKFCPTPFRCYKDARKDQESEPIIRYSPVCANDTDEEEKMKQKISAM